MSDLLFQQLFDVSAMLEAFSSKFGHSRVRGVDRLAGRQFADRAEAELGVVAQKCLAGTFRFSPFLEILKTKGRNKNPRVIGVPTIRDRVVLHQLNRYLATVYPESVPRNIASAYVRSLSNDLHLQPLEDTWVCGVDIKAFYDSIPHAGLLKRLDNSATSSRAQRLVRHAILTPTIPRNCRRAQQSQYRPHKGVPQGLSISNILASAYLRDVDEAMAKFNVKYYRYVDDVLIYGARADVEGAAKTLRARLRARGLSMHAEGSGKWHFDTLGNPFSYLGYRFAMPIVTVRESSSERFLHSVASLIADYTHGIERKRALHPYLTPSLQREIFVAELNERIAGAISENRRFGWVAFFNQINDLPLLHRMDNTIGKMVRRMRDAEHIPLASIKKLARAYFEIKFNPKGGYAQDYDEIDTLPKRIEFLRRRGLFDPDKPLTEEQINERFEQYRGRVLSQMQEDEGFLY